MEGLLLVGELLGVREDRERTWTDRNGVGHTDHPATVRVLVGAAIERVAYRTVADAAAAVGTAGRRETVSLPVRNLYGVRDGKPWQFYQGVAPFDEGREG